ncbi:hypothetical protein OW763_09430 [Clostridium aestuarii]|uniref:Holin n=1 Tax=Clostridium aestuarii TaxID=338193 RepID=A0ABT4D002_9CLOT|nr:hypothetical protein [Clostridium aestuarii]MCY6484561.1 hypothetical protein [Clostridium aestuarii]
MNISPAIFELFVSATIVDVLVDFIKIIFNRYFKRKDPKYKDVFSRVVSILIGLIFCIFYNLDFPDMCGLTSTINYVGEIITGILISRGSNVIHDNFKKFCIYNTKI